MIPAALGDFTIESLLGEGGSSLVYAARRTSDPTEELALKVLHPDLGLTERETERFLDEARKLNQIAHPAIVSLRASGRLPDGRPFIAMPRLKGQSLGDRLRSEPIPTARAIALFADVARALSALHEAGLLHRDIKPDNVFSLEPDERLMLLDLGIARDTESSPGTTTRAGLSRGTPEYMAPERLFGQRATVKTDVYELTLLLYVMLARRPPWNEGDAHARLDPRLDPELSAALPAPLVKTIEDGLALDVARRPASVRELLDRIETAIVGTPLDAARPSQRESSLSSSFELPATRLVLTPRGPIPTEPSLATAPTDLHTPTPLSAFAPSTPPQPVPVVSMAPPPMRSALIPIGVGLAVLAVGIGGGFVIAHKAASGGGPTASATDNAAPASTIAMVPAGVASMEAPASASALATPSASATSAAGPSALPSSVPPNASGGPTAPRASAAPSAVSSNAPTTPPVGKAMPPACSNFLALMCSPTSGARPEECTAWKNNVNDWVTKNPANAAHTCDAAYSASKSGLELRKNSPPPSH